MRRFDVLDPTTPIFGPHILEASAGTGKTFAVENLFIRHLLESNISLEEILIVTFTNRAVYDLKKRIRGNLEKAFFRGEKRVGDLLFLFERAQIFTIHAFCLKMLKEHTLLADSPLDSDSLAKKTIFDYLKYELDLPPSQKELFLKEDLDRLIVKLADLGNSTEETFLELKEAFEKRLTKFRNFKEVPFDELAPHFKKKFPLENLKEDLSFLTHIFARGSLSPDDFDRVVSGKFNFIRFFSGENKKVRSEISWDKLAIFEEIKLELLPIVEKALSRERFLKRLARECSSRVEKALQEKGVISPDNILKKMREALEDSRFLEKVRARYKVLMVDEFQDTDEIQYQIFKKLFWHDKMVSFYLIGDPKQSIYGFRNADLYTYMEAKNLIGEESHLHLDTNFRSSSSLLEALNALFSKREWLFLPKINKTIPYLPIKAGAQEGAIEDGRGSIHFLLKEGTFEEEFFLPKIAEECVKFINSLKVAILVKDRFQARKVKDFLLRKKIPCFTASSRLLFKEMRAFSHFRDLYDAVLTLDVKRVAAGPYFNFNEEELGRLKIFFFRLNEILKKGDLPLFFHELFKYEPFVKNIAGDPSLYEETVAIMERLLEGFDFDSLALEERSFFSQSSGVEVLTMHASKGLEFDVVVALGLGKEDLFEQNSEIEAEKMRLLYVTLTRAKKRVYVPIALDERSLFHQFFFSKESLLENIQNMKNISFEWVEDKEIDLSFEKEKKTPIEPDIVSYNFQPLSVKSFSSFQNSESTFVHVDDPLPSGAETGTIFHSILERFLKERGEIVPIVRSEIRGTLLESHEDKILDIMQKTLNASLDGFSLLDVDPQYMFIEDEFMFAWKDEFLKGFVDLIFFHNGKYYLLDWKTNLLPSYGEEELKKAMKEHDYFLQAAIYTEAFARRLKFFTKEPFSDIFGGSFYLFLRGIKPNSGDGIYHFKPTLDVLYGRI